MSAPQLKFSGDNESTQNFLSRFPLTTRRLSYRHITTGSILLFYIAEKACLQLKITITYNVGRTHPLHTASATDQTLRFLTVRMQIAQLLPAQNGRHFSEARLALRFQFPWCALDLTVKAKELIPCRCVLVHQNANFC